MANPDRRRFQVIGSGYGSTIYAVELSNGLVKVGFSRNPCSRMKSLCAEVRRTFDAQILRFHIGAALPLRSAIKAETILISGMASMAKLATPGRREYFQGADFLAAQALVDQVCSVFLPDAKSLPIKAVPT